MTPIRGEIWKAALLSAALCLAVPAWTEAGPKLPGNALPVPIITQNTDYSCGAAVLIALLIYWEAPFDGFESDLYPILDTTPKDGTEPQKIAEGARRFGLDAEFKLNMTLDDLRAHLKRGDTVILDIQAWRDPESGLPWKDTWDDGHYVVLVAMDKKFAYVMDPSTDAAYAYLPLDELMERWHDYEDRTGTIVRHYQAGVVIRGKKPMRRFPGELVRLE